MSERLEYKLIDGVAHVTMNDGKLNLMTVAMLQELDAAFTRAENEANLLVLRSGVSGIFSAGFDLKVFARNDAEQSLEMVRLGAELALRLIALPIPTLGIMQGHAFPMGTFLLLACDVRIAEQGPYRMGLNEVAIRIAPPSFAIELARSRVHPAWLSRTVTLGEMFEPDEAKNAGFLDRTEPVEQIEQAINETISALKDTHIPSHAAAKLRLRQHSMTLMRQAIDSELTIEAYKRRSASTIKMPS